MKKDRTKDYSIYARSMAEIRRELARIVEATGGRPFDVTEIVLKPRRKTVRAFGTNGAASFTWDRIDQRLSVSFSN